MQLSSFVLLILILFASDLSLLLRVDRATGFVAVQDFLKAFPECLEEFVAAHVSAEDLERLLIRKTHRTVDFFTGEETCRARGMKKVKHTFSEDLL